MTFRPHPGSVPADHDDELQALRDELRSLRASLNAEHHPVRPGDPERIADLEARIAELTTAIAERRRALRSAHA